VSRFRLLALDIDGTLLGSDRSISPRTRAALAAARGTGARLVLVTGRRHPSARRIADELGGDFPLVLHNGALIIENGAVIRCRPLGRRTALLAVRVGREAGADPVLHCGLGGEGRILAQGIAPSNTLLAYYLDKSHPDVTTVAHFESALDTDPLQVMFGATIAEMDALLPILAAALGGSARIERTVYPRSGVGLLDILDPGVGKAEALGFLQERYGVPAAETLAIGDNWNDREMLERAGLGLVMGNADVGLHRLGLPVLPTNDEDGVAVAIDRYVLVR
jgi:hypothetical protein